MTNRKSQTGLTLHQKILSDIEHKIVSGDWPPGYRLPFEVDLAKSYDVSRMTVNKVMTQLAGAGLVERRKKSGTFVAQPRAQSAILEISDIEVEVSALDLPYSFSVLSSVERAAAAADITRFEVSTGDNLLQIKCVHFAGTKPFCLEERLISLETVPEARQASFEGAAPGQWLLKQVPWSAAEHKILAVTATPETAGLLEIPKGAACLVVERRTWSETGPVTFVRITYPGDSHTIIANFRPASINAT
ncbi:histidine utilization repressor [Agrobacterium sp. ES01]|uniref:histidine utilization repressor n=1 Tax=Agrobacterium sp. ES01 TaxID=3420714 RepID=UPI003D1006E0